MADNLRQVFNEIAASWYNFRHHTVFRRELEALAEQWQSGRLLNIGCGHGPDFMPFARRLELHGIDFSETMVALARRYAAKFNFAAAFAMADARALPYRDNAFDFAIAIATYHHLEPGDRLVAFQELKRVLKPGGNAFITVWNRWQARFWWRGNEVLVPWRTKDRVLYRYYNLFSYRSLTRLAKEAGLQVKSVSPEKSYRFPVRLFSRNICLLVQKSA